MIWVGCQLRFFSHVGDGAPDVPLRRVTPFCFITNFCRRAVLGNIASIFFTKHRTLYEYRKNEQTTKSGRRGRRPLQLWMLLIRIPPLNTFIPTRKSDFIPAIPHNKLYNMLPKPIFSLIDIVQPYKNHINDLK